ncbi:hypothetical protein GCM10022403_009240 [Streptomyces coacervatus]|uniref:Uncharacterized protein n=1 Tax=Streptomyces coacervatus TaxID=647381 RepID=A0ABP7GXM5_9ACTN|nr:hypothetical protein [Streptomyces coacervatus]MDF2268307.1 hypothetical protein [Streptomyces coacervatus]
MNRAAHALLHSTLRARHRDFVRLTGWSLLQAVPTLPPGQLMARAAFGPEPPPDRGPQ